MKKNNPQKPPRIAEWILNRILDENISYSASGDIEETFYTVQARYGRIKSSLWYWFQIIIFTPKFLQNSFQRKFVMFKNYLKVAFRNMKRQKVYASLNIFGLATAISCCILIWLYVSNEYSFDKFHNNKDSIYRFIAINYNPDGSEKSLRTPGLPAPITDELVEVFPEIKYYSRFTSGSGRVKYKNRVFREKIHMADASFFKMFSFSLMHGNPATALHQDDAIVLTRRYADKYFGNENSIGKTITIAYGQIEKEYIVTGINEDIPGNSTIQYDLIMNISNLPICWGYDEALTTWYDFNYPVYFKLKNDTSIKAVEQRLPAFFDMFFSQHAQRARDLGEWTGKGHQFSLGVQRMSDIHFNPNVSGGIDPIYCHILTGIAVIILIIACINFMNISIGMSSIRSTEIGIRKVAGAGRNQLIRQFWSESFIICGISMVIGLLFAVLLLPKFNEFTGRQLRMADITDITNVTALCAILLTAGILAGSYPALIMARFRLVDILKGRMKLGTKKIFTKSLVIVQFTLSICLILYAVIIRNQLTFMINKDMGYNTDGLISVRIQGGYRVVELFRENILPHKDVFGVSACTNTFGRGYSHESVIYKGRVISFLKNQVDYDFINTIGLEITEGRNFSRNYTSDSLGVIVNEKFIEEMGGFEGDSPIGEIIGDPAKDFPHNLRIIGVVKNFHFRSLHREIYPVIFHLYPDNGLHNMLIRISPNNVHDTISFLEKNWKNIQPDKMFIFSFLQEDLEYHYNSDKKWEEIITHSAVFAIIIAFLGMFGLTSLSLNRRVKEIGIRKVLGAKVVYILGLIISDFILLIIIANCIAWPAVYFVASNWLENFAYRNNPGISLFILVGLLTLFFAVATICIQSIKAALASPVDSLKYE